jgi:hypothetical protein
MVEKLKIGMKREEVVALFGEPDMKGATSRKYPTPSVFRYGLIEFHFAPWKNGGLVFVQEVRLGIGHFRKLFPKTD